MNDNSTKILNYVIENCEMALNAIDDLSKRITCDTMLEEINKEEQEYRTMHEKAKNLIGEHGGEVKHASCMSKCGESMGVKMNLMMDHTESHIAEMLIQGTYMGIIELVKIKNANPDIETDILEIVDSLLHYQEERIERLKKYL